MITSKRIHYFTNIESPVTTKLIGNGEYTAYLTDDIMTRGYGQTRIAAIADLKRRVAELLKLYS